MVVFDWNIYRAHTLAHARTCGGALVSIVRSGVYGVMLGEKLDRQRRESLPSCRFARSTVVRRPARKVDWSGAGDTEMLCPRSHQPSRSCDARASKTPVCLHVAGRCGGCACRIGHISWNARCPCGRRMDSVSKHRGRCIRLKVFLSTRCAKLKKMPLLSICCPPVMG